MQTPSCSTNTASSEKLLVSIMKYFMHASSSWLVASIHRCRNWGGAIFTLESLLIFIHAAQIATSQCILCLPLPPSQMELLPTPIYGINKTFTKQNIATPMSTYVDPQLVGRAIKCLGVIKWDPAEIWT